MLSCQDFRDRLYDEDCRRAVAGDAPIPADLSLHRDACAECREEWNAAADDLLHLPVLLAESAPASLERRIRVAVAERSIRTAAPLDWSDGAVWAALGAAAASLANGPLSTWLPGLGPLGIALLGASMAFAVNASRRVLRDALR
jgi:hypothetical protein